MAKVKIQDYIAGCMDSFGRENGYELSRCEFVKEGQFWYLRVFVDKLEGEGFENYGYMSSDDCALVSGYLSDCLDRDDPITQNYYLEVSSPGLDRLLVSDKDFSRFAGRRVEVRLYKAIEGRKHFEAVLTGLENGLIGLDTDEDKHMTVSREAVSKVNLVVVV